MHRETIPSSTAAIRMLTSAGSTLTSLTLDWVLDIPHMLGPPPDPVSYVSWTATYLSLFGCRFPHLRAFQFRNCVVRDTVLLPGFYLLDRSFQNVQDTGAIPTLRNTTDGKASPMDLTGLAFMEAHPKLQCLAWPMNHFFAPGGVSQDIAARVHAVVENLGQTLTDLRIDSLYSGSGEAQSEYWTSPDLGA